MAINFFESKGKTSSANTRFGLCDDPSPAKNPAYIDETDSSKWIGEVSNPASVNCDFYAIDNCVDIRRPNGELDKRCDGMLKYSNQLIFVELKERGYSGWLEEARGQLSATVLQFKANHQLIDYKKIEAYICNKQRPFFSKNHIATAQRFKDETELELKVQREIIID